MGFSGQILQRFTPTLMAGRLRQKIDLVQVSKVQDSTGGTSLLSNTLYANVWASVEGVSGDEKYVGKDNLAQVSHQIVIRYIGAAPSWLGNNNYLESALVKDDSGFLQQAQGAGTSGATQPVWNETIGGFTADGDPSTGVTWKNVGVAPTRTGVVSAMQVIFNGRLFQITAVINVDERNKFLILLCVEQNDSSFVVG